ncbi:MAG: hypothetical protein ACI8Y4_004285 [Candidatus Poriferisodalaceae bacterium]|jgi:hypothetical protein
MSRRALIGGAGVAGVAIIGGAVAGRATAFAADSSGFRRETLIIDVACDGNTFREQTFPHSDPATVGALRFPSKARCIPKGPFPPDTIVTHGLGGTGDASHVSTVRAIGGSGRYLAALGSASRSNVGLNNTSSLRHWFDRSELSLRVRPLPSRLELPVRLGGVYDPNETSPMGAMTCSWDLSESGIWEAPLRAM